MAMKVSLLSVRPGGTHGSALDAVVEDYLGRCGKGMPAVAKIFRTEAALVDWATVEARGGGAALWIADLGGLVMTTETLAERLGWTRDGGTRHLMLAVGPANGWTETGRGAATLRLALSAMTLPHELARLVLAEQVYRAGTILQGHPYHLGH
jgi:23S rRNA (pseudouridine1915-N3)-methyltransferase